MVPPSGLLGLVRYHRAQCPQSRARPECDLGWGVWSKRFFLKNCLGGRPRLLALVRATPRAEVDVVGAQLCSFAASAILPWLAFSCSDGSLSLLSVDNSPNMHNTGFFPDCLLLSVTNGSIWKLYLARYSETFKQPNFQVVKWKFTFIWKMLSEKERSGGTSEFYTLCFDSHPSSGCPSGSAPSGKYFQLLP